METTVRPSGVAGREALATRGAAPLGGRATNEDGSAPPVRGVPPWPHSGSADPVAHPAPASRDDAAERPSTSVPLPTARTVGSEVTERARPVDPFRLVARAPEKPGLVRAPAIVPQPGLNSGLGSTSGASAGLGMVAGRSEASTTQMLAPAFVGQGAGARIPRASLKPARPDVGRSLPLEAEGSLTGDTVSGMDQAVFSTRSGLTTGSRGKHAVVADHSAAHHRMSLLPPESQIEAAPGDRTGWVATEAVDTQIGSPAEPTGTVLERAKHDTPSRVQPEAAALAAAPGLVSSSVGGTPRTLGSLPAAAGGEALQAEMPGEPRIGPPIDRVSIRLTDSKGGNTRIAVTVRGHDMRARIVSSDPELSEQLDIRLHDLQRSLAGRGFETTKLAVTRPASGGDAKTAAAAVTPAQPGYETNSFSLLREGPRGGDDSTRHHGTAHQGNDGSRSPHRSPRERER